MKIDKGSAGYVQNQKKIRAVRTGILFAVVFAIFGAGLALNQGDRRSIYSIIAAVGCIPAAMSAVSMIMIWMRRPVTTAFAEEMRRLAGDARLLMELYVTTSEHGLYLHAAVIRDDTVALYSPDPKSDAALTTVVSHIRSALNQSCGPVEVSASTDINEFRIVLRDLASRETEDPTLQDDIARILLALSL